jgi:hypothetical protein
MIPRWRDALADTIGGLVGAWILTPVFPVARLLPSSCAVAIALNLTLLYDGRGL